jgi:hypothetical protein
VARIAPDRRIVGRVARARHGLGFGDRLHGRSVRIGGEHQQNRQNHTVFSLHRGALGAECDRHNSGRIESVTVP